MLPSQPLTFCTAVSQPGKSNCKHTGKLFEVSSASHTPEAEQTMCLVVQGSCRLALSHAGSQVMALTRHVKY